MGSIDRPKHSLHLTLRHEYVAICAPLKHVHCSAMLLAMFEHWTNFKWQAYDEAMRERERTHKRGDDFTLRSNLWVHFTQDEIKSELYGLFGDTMIAKALNDLVDMGYLKRRNNPNNKVDRTYQYLLRTNVIERDIWLWAASENAPPKVQGEARKRGQTLKSRLASRKTKRTIPQDSTQTDLKDNASTDAHASKPKSTPPQVAPDYDLVKPRILALVSSGTKTNMTQITNAIPKPQRKFVKDHVQRMIDNGLLVDVGNGYMEPGAEDDSAEIANRLDAAEQSEAQRKRDIFDAIQAAFGYTSPTKSEDGQMRRAARVLAETGITADKVVSLYQYCAERYTHFGPMALTTNYSAWCKQSRDGNPLAGLRLVS